MLLVLPLWYWALVILGLVALTCGTLGTATGVLAILRTRLGGPGRRQAWTGIATGLAAYGSIMAMFALL